MIIVSDDDDLNLINSVHLACRPSLNSLPIIDEVRNRCLQRLGGGGPAKIPGTAGRFHGNPVSGNELCKQPPISTIRLKELQWRNLTELIPTMKHFL